MSRINCSRAGCRDVFHSYLVKDAEYDGDIEIPILKPENKIPNRLISFSKAINAKDFNQWVHFYEDDYKFERVWNNPQKYLPILQRFKGIITPDFSIYRDMPLIMQAWNTYRGKALGHWWQSKGLTVLPNVRAGDERSFSFCCLGIVPGGTICIGSHGCMKNREEREIFKRSLKAIIAKLTPSHIVVYGSIPNDIFSFCSKRGIIISQFDSEFAISRKEMHN